MGSYSTIYISSTKAKEYILNKLMCMSDNELEKLMDSFLENKLYNCRIDDEGQDDDRI